MRQARFKRNRGVYKCHTFGTLQHYLQMARFINLQMLGIFSICQIADRIAGITKPGQR